MKRKWVRVGEFTQDGYGSCGFPPASLAPYRYVLRRLTRRGGKLSRTYWRLYAVPLSD